MRTILPASLVVVALAVAARGEEPHTFLGKTVEGWLGLLRDKASTAAQRREAAVMLGCFGPEARAAAPDLIEAVRTGPLRDEAVDALVSIGAGAEVTVPVLIDRFMKRGSQAFTRMGSFPFDPSVDKALARVGEPAVPALLKILDGPDVSMRICAAYTLGELGPAARAAVPSLIRAVERSDPGRESASLRLQAIRALGRIGPEARAAAPALSAALDRNRIRSYEFDLVIALDRIGAPPVRRLLDTFLRDGDPNIADQLAWLGTRAREAVPDLHTALTDKRLQVRVSAAVALAHIDPSATESVPVLIEGMRRADDEEIDVSGVPQALARLGPRAKAAIPMLSGLVTRGWADADRLEALLQIDPEAKECLPALIEALESDDCESVGVAADCLSVLGPRVKKAIPALVTALTRDFNENACVEHNPRVGAARALRRIDTHGQEAIPALIRALERRHAADDDLADYDATEAAAEILGTYGARAQDAIPALIAALRSRARDDADWTVRPAAALALGRIGPAGRVAIPALRDFTYERRGGPRLQAEAVIALYDLAPDGRAIAERWLAKPVPFWTVSVLHRELESRAVVLGAMGRTNFESDWVTRRYLDQLDWILAHSDPRRGAPYKHFESWLETFSRLGVAGRLAIPRLKGLRDHPSPFVRMWAAETLERITPHE
jgi:HEAT repeat protein